MLPRKMFQQIVDMSLEFRKPLRIVSLVDQNVLRWRTLSSNLCLKTDSSSLSYPEESQGIKVLQFQP